MTSNPFFAFHDDVFPAFAKNAAFQVRFPLSVSRTTIIPDNLFSSLKELRHISSVKMEMNGTESFQFDLHFPKTSRGFEEVKILELIFFDGTSLLSFGVHFNGSFWVDSDYFDERFVSPSRIESTKMTFHFHTFDSVNSSFFEISEEQFKIGWKNFDKFSVCGYSASD